MSGDNGEVKQPENQPEQPIKDIEVVKVIKRGNQFIPLIQNGLEMKEVAYALKLLEVMFNEGMVQSMLKSAQAQNTIIKTGNIPPWMPQTKEGITKSIVDRLRGKI